LCAGVRDAYNLAWKLDAVLKQKADESLLDTYGAERRPHVQTVVEHAKSFGLIIGELDEQAALVRDQRLGAELAAGTAPTIRQSFIPGLEAGLLSHGTDGALQAGAGALFPQPWVTGFGVNRIRLDDLMRGEFYLVSLDARLSTMAAQHFAATDHLSTAKSVFIGTHVTETANNVIAVEEDIGLVQRWLVERNVLAALVRPDGFAYGVAQDAAQIDKLISELDAALAGEATSVGAMSGGQFGRV
jgi:3-(3-hydroxy-phenyl)propionate hydroxylase